MTLEMFDWFFEYFAEMSSIWIGHVNSEPIKRFWKRCLWGSYKTHQRFTTCLPLNVACPKAVISILIAVSHAALLPFCLTCPSSVSDSRAKATRFSRATPWESTEPLLWAVSGWFSACTARNVFRKNCFNSALVEQSCWKSLNWEVTRKALTERQRLTRITTNVT